MARKYTTLTLTSAQVTALASGTAVVMTSPNQIPYGSTITLQPPSQSGFNPSPPGTVVMAGSNAVITDNSGNQWGITSNGLVAVAVYPSTTLVPDTTTANVTELYFGSNGDVYQENQAGGWWLKASPTDTWHNTSNPTGGGGGGGGSVSITVPIFLNGVFAASGDWNAEPMNYAYAASGVNGPGPVIDWPAYGDNPYWLPYKQNAPGNGNPASNGVGYNVTGCTYFTFAVKPSSPGLDLQMYLYIAQGSQDDIYYNTTPLDVCQSKYLVSGPGMETSGVWSVYKVPLADFGTPLDWYYKINVFKQGNATQDCQLDQVGFG